MTNGEKLKEMFPNIEIAEITNKLVKYVRVEIKDKDSKKVSSWVADIDINWWNAECNKSIIDDCISRADLYNRIKGIDHDEDYECDEFGGSKITYHTCDWDEVLREIEDAPSVIPQQRIGKWIKSRDGYGNNHYTCPFCEHDIATKYDGTWEDNYCSNCGAKMEIEE